MSMRAWLTRYPSGMCSSWPYALCMSVSGRPVTPLVRSCSSFRRAWNAPGFAIGSKVGFGTLVLARPIIVVPNTM